MKNKLFFAGLLIAVLTITFMAAGCGTTGGNGTQKPDLDESLRRYMAPQSHTWDEGEAYVYYLDPLQFEKFRAELKAGGEYQQTDSWNEDNRDWDRGKTFARWIVRPDGGFELDLCRENNSRSGYRYEKTASNGSPAAIRPRLDASLRKYMGPNPQTWDGEVVNVYFLDPLRFEEFRAELDAGVEYFQTGSGSEDNRDWDRGKDFARWVVRSDGSMGLDLMRKDNSRVEYRYEKTANLAAKLGGEGKAVMDVRTIRLTGDVNLGARFYVPGGFTLEVPAGLTLDLTAEGVGIELLNGATLTVNGTVNTSGHGDHGKGWVEGGLRLGEGTVVINGSGTINLKSKGSVLNISGKKHLTLDGVTLAGIKDNDRSLVNVGEGSEFVMKSGAITGNTSTGWGGGLSIGENAIFTMKGGEISGNTADGDSGGGGVYAGGTFIMQGGMISGNTADFGGGVQVQVGTFIMEGGVISGNTAGFGGGVRVWVPGTFIKKGGTIYGDTDKNHTSGSTENTALTVGGHAVMPGGNKKRDATAGEEIILYAKFENGVWTFNDSSPGGVGDTTANWE